MHIAMIGQKGFDVGESGGGVERHVSELAGRFALLGHRVSVYSREPYSGELHENISVRVLQTVRRKNLETIVHTFLSTLDALRGDYDIYHYHGVGPSLVSWIPRVFKRNARVVVTFHSQDRFHKKWSRFAKFILRVGEWTACWVPHVTIAVSHSIQVFAREKIHRQIVYIPNGAEVKVVDESSELDVFGLVPEKYILSVSRLVPHKGQHYLIEAFLNLIKENPELTRDLSLVVVGAENYGTHYQAQLSQLAEGNSRIRFLGFQGGETLAQLFAHARLFVHASEAEGLPIVVLEAMSFGLPVLVSDIPENLEVLHHKGFTFTSGSVPDLMTSLKWVLEHPAQLESASVEVRDVIDQYFNWDTITHDTLQLYRSVRH
jgi:glycosyltransferase involved in cell wall biosynthesis